MHMMHAKTVVIVHVMSVYIGGSAVGSDCTDFEESMLLWSRLPIVPLSVSSGCWVLPTNILKHLLWAESRWGGLCVCH